MMTDDDIREVILAYVVPTAPAEGKALALMRHVLGRTGLDSPAAERLWRRDRSGFCTELRKRSSRLGELLTRGSPQRKLDPYTDVI